MSQIQDKMDNQKVQRQMEKQLSSEIANDPMMTASVEEDKSEVQKPTLVKKQVLVDKPQPSPKNSIKIPHHNRAQKSPKNPSSPFSPKSNWSHQLGNIIITENIAESPKIRILEREKVFQCLI